MYTPSRRRVGPRGAATWPWVPGRIHVGPARKKSAFCHLNNYFKRYKSKINSEKSEKKSLKIENS